MEKYLLDSEKKTRKRWFVFLNIQFFIAGLIFLILPLIILLNEPKTLKKEFILGIIFLNMLAAIIYLLYYLCSYKGFGTKFLAFTYWVFPLADLYYLFQNIASFVLPFKISDQIKLTSPEIEKIQSAFALISIIVLVFILVHIYWYILCYRLRKINLRVSKLYYFELAKESIEQMESCTSLGQLEEAYDAAVKHHPEAKKVLREFFKTRKDFIEKNK